MMICHGPIDMKVLPEHLRLHPSQYLKNRRALLQKGSGRRNTRTAARALAV
jgi:hypothetical protein